MKYIYYIHTKLIFFNSELWNEAHPFHWSIYFVLFCLRCHLTLFVLEHRVFKTKHLKCLLQALIRGFEWIEMLSLILQGVPQRLFFKIFGRDIIEAIENKECYMLNFVTLASKMFSFQIFQNSSKDQQGVRLEMVVETGYSYYNCIWKNIFFQSNC